jgi:hypothetical protein
VSALPLSYPTNPCLSPSSLIWQAKEEYDKILPHKVKYGFRHEYSKNELSIAKSLVEKFGTDISKIRGYLEESAVKEIFEPIRDVLDLRSDQYDYPPRQPIFPPSEVVGGGSGKAVLTIDDLLGDW